MTKRRFHARACEADDVLVSKGYFILGGVCLRIYVYYSSSRQAAWLSQELRVREWLLSTTQSMVIKDSSIGRVAVELLEHHSI